MTCFVEVFCLLTAFNVIITFMSFYITWSDNNNRLSPEQVDPQLIYFASYFT